MGGYREHVDFGGAPNGVATGLYTKSTGGDDFTLLQRPTFGTPAGGVYPGGFAFNNRALNNRSYSFTPRSTELWLMVRVQVPVLTRLFGEQRVGPVVTVSVQRAFGQP